MHRIQVLFVETPHRSRAPGDWKVVDCLSLIWGYVITIYFTILLFNYINHQILFCFDVAAPYFPGLQQIIRQRNKKDLFSHQKIQNFIFKVKFYSSNEASNDITVFVRQNCQRTAKFSLQYEGIGFGFHLPEVQILQRLYSVLLRKLFNEIQFHLVHTIPGTKSDRSNSRIVTPLLIRWIAELPVKHSIIEEMGKIHGTNRPVGLRNWNKVLRSIKKETITVGLMVYW